MKTLILAALRCSLIFLLAMFAQAGSATWRLNPMHTNGDWNFDRNWTEGGPPNGGMDTATFGESNVRRVHISENTEVYGITFNAAATNPFTITASPFFTLTLSGEHGGITNSSPILQKFEAAVNGQNAAGQIVFNHHATAGSSTQFTNRGGREDFAPTGTISFEDHSNAGSGMFINNGGEGDGGDGGSIEFDNSSAEGATFTNRGGTVRGTFGAYIYFLDGSTAGSGTFTNKAGEATETTGGTIIFGSESTPNDNSTADHATFMNEGASGIGIPQGHPAGPCATGFTGHASAGSGTFINEAGRAAGANGGQTNFAGDSNAGDATTGNGSTFTNKGAAVAGAEAGATLFFDSSRADRGLCNFINEGGTAGGPALGAEGGFTKFVGTVTPFEQPIAGGTFTNKAGTVPYALSGHTDFGINSYAGNGSFTNNGATVAFAVGGYTRFASNSSAGNGTFTNEGTTVAGFSGGIAGSTFFVEDATAGNGRFNNLGGNGSFAGGGYTLFKDNSKAGSATLIANGGTNGGLGGEIIFSDNSTGDSSQVELSGNGTLSIFHNAPGVTIGSLTSRGAGGNVILGGNIQTVGGNNLTVGSNNMDTMFSGVIQDDVSFPGGSLTKIGTGTLTLSRHNTYTGGTTINEGKLVVSNSTGSGTGSGDVLVTGSLGGTKLGGTGIIAGAVTVGTPLVIGTAVLSPGINEGSIGTLKILNSLTFQQNGTYHVELDRGPVRPDKVEANGVTINASLPGSRQFILTDLGTGMLPINTMVTVIHNMSMNPIVGRFANLDQGSTLTVGSNIFQANYGNDLTLTVVGHP